MAQPDKEPSDVRAKVKPHWYLITEFYCPVCARSTIYRERRYGKRPPDAQRREIIDAYDYCDAL